MISQDSAKFWFPKLANHEWQWMRDWLPKTVLVDYSEEALSPSLAGTRTEEYERLYYEVESMILDHIGYPAFIRTDLTSAKHAGVKAYKIESCDDINHALLTTLSQAQLKSYFSKVKSSAIMVREFIRVKHERTAFGGLPIGQEWRVFADQISEQCHHGYWPEEALSGHMDDGKEPSAPALTHPLGGWIYTDALDASALAAKAMGAGKWSIDFVKDVNDKVWLVDMATAGNSYHHPECPYYRLDKADRL